MSSVDPIAAAIAALGALVFGVFVGLALAARTGWPAGRRGAAGGLLGRVRVEGTALGLDEATGALVVYAPKGRRGEAVRLLPGLGSGGEDRPVIATVVEREVDGRRVFAAVFPRLPAGGYRVFGPGRDPRATGVTVFAGAVAEVDWR